MTRPHDGDKQASINLYVDDNATMTGSVTTGGIRFTIGEHQLTFFPMGLLRFIYLADELVSNGVPEDRDRPSTFVSEPYLDIVEHEPAGQPG